MAKIVNVQEVSLKSLKPYKNNAKIHSDFQVDKIVDSIKEFGFVSPCLVDKDLNLIAGHGRVMAAERLKMETVPCVFVEGLSDAQRRAYILADNKLSELGEWDDEIVASEISALMKDGFDIDLTGFIADQSVLDNSEINELDVGEDLGGFIAESDEYVPKTKIGQIWKLGNHKLMIADSSDSECVKKLCGDVSVDLLETDPPYNVALGEKWKSLTTKGRKDDLVISNDNIDEKDFAEFLKKVFLNASSVMKPGAAFYIWHASSNAKIFLDALIYAGLTMKQTLIWAKNIFVIGRSDYQWKHEPCFYGWKDGATHYFQPARNISTLFKSDRDYDDWSKEDLVRLLKAIDEVSDVDFVDKPISSRYHPTMKPIEIIKKHIKNSSRENDVVLDLFGGSGTTLLACEEMHRKCLMMEFDPVYADVIINRWEEMTGEKAELVEEVDLNE